MSPCKEMVMSDKVKEYNSKMKKIQLLFLGNIRLEKLFAKCIPPHTPLLWG